MRKSKNSPVSRTNSSRQKRTPPTNAVTLNPPVLVASNEPGHLETTDTVSGANKEGSEREKVLHFESNSQDTPVALSIDWETHQRTLEECKALKDLCEKLRRSLEHRFKELGSVTHQLIEKEKQLSEAKAKLVALESRVSNKNTNSTSVRALLSKLRPKIRSRSAEARIAAQIQEIAESGLFDETWYEARYPEVASSALSPIEYFVRYGLPKGHNPGPFFDAANYCKRYPDVAKAHAVPLLHYIRHGRAEGRIPVSN